MKTLILFAVLFSGPLFARYSSVDDGACSAKVAPLKMDIEDASCVGKDCSCYTKAFKAQIDGLASKRKQQVDQGLEDTYVEAATAQMKDLLDMDLLTTLRKGNLGGSQFPAGCSFDSLRSVLSCKNEKAKRIVTAIQKNFLNLSEYNVEESQKQSIESKSQCLSPSEQRGIALISAKEAGEERLLRGVKKITKSEWEKLLKADNPLELIQGEKTRSFRRVERALRYLPVLGAVFSSKESLQKFYEMYQADKSGKFLESFYEDPAVMKTVTERAVKKCEMIFKSIDTLACQNSSDFYVVDEGFNNKVFSYYTSGTSDQRENNLENHLFYCESKRCLTEKCSKKKGYSPQEFIETLASVQTASASIDMNSKMMGPRLCPGLVCPLSNKDILTFANSNVLKGCEPLAKEKRNPVELYASLGCPGGKECDTPFGNSLRVYASFWKASYQPNEVASDEEQAEGEEVRLTARKTKRSDFVEAFVGEVGKDIEAFFAEETPVQELAKKEKKEEPEVVTPSKKRMAQRKVMPRPVNTNFTGAERGFGSQSPTGFQATQIPVDVVDGKSVDTKMVEDAIDTARESINEAKRWQQAYRDSVKRNDSPASGSSNPSEYDRERMNTSEVGNRSGETTVVNNTIEVPTSGGQALLPAEATTEYQGQWIDYKEAKAGGKGRAPASKTPSLMIDRSKLAELNKSLLEEFKIDPLKPFVLKVWIKEGSQKKLVEIAVENMFYKGKMILKPIKDEINSDIFKEVLNSPIFFDYRNMLAEREERREFFKNVLPNIKKL